MLNHVASLCYTLFGSPSRNTVPLGPTEEDVAELLGVCGLLKRPTWAACAPDNGGTGRAAAWQACRCGRRTSTITARSSAGSTSRPVVVFSLSLSPSLRPTSSSSDDLSTPFDSFRERAHARARASEFNRNYSITGSPWRVPQAQEKI